jgi:(p)ppGpp synthase/HD superfamily hydrolase
VTGPHYSTRLDQALALAADAFRHQERKGTGVPYLTHLLQVMVYVGEHGGDEDQLIAAVLHDYLEDIEGASASDLRDRFGDRVARLVEAMSDSTTHPKPPWQERKQRYVDRLAREPAELKLICCADKLHNARSIRRDVATLGEALWQRFTASREQTLWYYRAIVGALGQGWTHPLLRELESEVEALHQQLD